MKSFSLTQMDFKNTLAYALQQDTEDPLKKYRAQFYFPRLNEREVVYFSGNTLGLQPKSTQDHILNELEDWASFGVQARFHARIPWLTYPEQFVKPISKIAGAKPSEVAVMNQLTVNLHLLMVSFYRPDKKKYKILCESGAFSSDQYAMETQTLFHGFQPEDAIIELSPRAGEHCLRMEDILEAIEKNKDSLALVLIGGVNYLTGQLFNMKQITAAAHKAGALAGFDLAHAIGNVKLELHDWDVDFAVWCSYKYLNSGPGGIAGIFIHERHASNTNLLRFAGRWGADNKGIGATMKKGFVPTPTAEGWQLSNFPIVLMAAHKAALDQFDEAGMDALVLKSLKLTAYLEFIIDVINPDLEQPFEIITPRNHHERGCQLSILTGNRGEELNTKLLQAGIIADWLEPNILRCAPVPFYNSFEDVYRFGDVLRRIS